MLQILPIDFAQEKTGNISEYILKKIRQVIYSLYQAKESTKNVYNSIMDSTKV